MNWQEKIDLTDAINNQRFKDTNWDFITLKTIIEEWGNFNDDIQRRIDFAKKQLIDILS